MRDIVDVLPGLINCRISNSEKKLSERKQMMYLARIDPGQRGVELRREIGCRWALLLLVLLVLVVFVLVSIQNSSWTNMRCQLACRKEGETDKQGWSEEKKSRWWARERAGETVEGGREGDGERWFIKHLEGWRADRPLHFAPLTVQETGDCM